MELIYAACSARLEQEVFTRIKRSLLAEEKMFVIVPAQAMFLMESQIIKRCRVPGFMTLEVLSFERLTDKLMEHTAGRALGRMRISGAAMLVRRAMDDVRGDLAVIDVEKDGAIHESVARLLMALKAEDVLPEDMREIARQANPLFGEKLEDIAKIYQAVQKYARPDLLDQRDAEEYARNLIGDSDYIKGAKIIVHGFDTLPASRIRTIAALLAAGCEVSVTLEAEEENEIFARGLRTMAALEGAARVAGVPYRKIKLARKQAGNPEIRHIEDNLFAFPAKKYRGEVSNVALYCAKDRWQEAELAAELILERAQEGMALSDVYILAADPNRYLPAIADVFSRAGIPFFFEGKRSILEHRLAVFILSAVDIVCTGRWGKVDVLRHIKTGLLPVSDEEADALVKYAQEHGLSGPAFRHVWEDAQIEVVRNRAMQGLCELEQAARGADAAAFAACVIEYIAKMAIRDELAQEADMIASVLPAESRFLKQVFDRAVAVLEQAAALLKGLAKKELKAVLEVGFSSAEISVVPPMSDEVTLGDVSHSIFPHKKLMIVLGANDGLLPAEPACNLLSEQDVAEINKMAFFPGSIQMEDHRLYLRRAFTFADRLVVSYNAEDGPPAMVIYRLNRIFPLLATQKPGVLQTEKGGLPALAAVLRKLADGEEADLSVLTEYLADEQGRKDLTHLIGGLFYDNRPKRISAPLAERLYAAATPSVSRIESYYSCPYRHFLEYGLRPKEVQAFEEDYRQSGSYLHALLDRVSKWTRGRDLADLREEQIRDMVEQAAEEERKTHNNRIFEKSRRFSFTEAYLKEEACQAMIAVREHLRGTGAQIAGAEIAFGKNSVLTIDTPEGQVRLIGKIDRVDTMQKEGECFARVVDYKTSEKRFDLKELYAGLDIQLVVYLIALVAAYKAVKPAGGFYMSVRLPYLLPGKDRMQTFTMHGLIAKGTEDLNTQTAAKGMLLNDRQIGLVMDYVRQMIGAAVKESLQGSNQNAPCDKEVCAYCKYRTVCRFDESYSGNALRDAEAGFDVFMEDLHNAAD